MAWRVYHECWDREDVLAVWMDSHALDHSIADIASFYGFISGLVKKELKRRGDTRFEKDGPLFSDYAGFREFLEQTAEARLTFCLVIEEFEKLAAKQFAGLSFLSNLRHLCDHDDYRFACVTISLRPLRESQSAEQLGSDFGNNFSLITVGLLEDKPLAELRAYGFKEDDWRLTEAELRQIHNVAGAFPLFNQIVLSHLFEAKKYGQAVEGAFVKAGYELLPHYETLWRKRSYTEQRALKDWANGKGDATIAYMVDLEGRGILVRSGEKQRLFSRWFDELIRNCLEVTASADGPKTSWYGKLMDKTKSTIGDTCKPIGELCNLLKKTNEAVGEGKKLGKNVIGLSSDENESGEG